MSAQIRGLHHVTATVNDAQEDLDFYAGLLGQRLVKKTVNFDNPQVYHFYYGNESGTPSTLMTTFPYRGWGVPVGRQGAGQITVTSFSVPAGSLGFWRQRLAEQGLTAEDEATAFGEEALRVRDPSGLVLRLVANARDERVPWVRPDVGDEHAIRGVHGVSLLVREPARSITFLEDLLGGTVVGEGADGTRVGVGGDAPGQLVELVPAGAAPEATNGLGTVHHVAFAVDDAAAQLEFRAELLRRGVPVTEVRDRQYFQSIYFHEPNGVLFEIATIPPGFATDEDLPDLGRALKLPPWEEPNRAAIEAALAPVRTGS
jgi:glyoxalase family protein